MHRFDAVLAWPRREIAIAAAELVGEDAGVAGKLLVFGHLGGFAGFGEDARPVEHLAETLGLGNVPFEFEAALLGAIVVVANARHATKHEQGNPNIAGQ